VPPPETTAAVPDLECSRGLPGRAKQEIVREQGCEAVRLLEGMYAKLPRWPTAYKRTDRTIVLRKWEWVG
jgi:hypothetical protein